MSERNTQSRELSKLRVPVAASTKVEAGKIAVANASGYGAEGSAATTLTYLGRWEETVDNSAGANGAFSGDVLVDRAFLWKNSGSDAVTQAELGKTCYIEDDETVAKTNGGSTLSAAGKVVGLESGGVWVAPVL